MRPGWVALLHEHENIGQAEETQLQKAGPALELMISHVGIWFYAADEVSALTVRKNEVFNALGRL